MLNFPTLNSGAIAQYPSTLRLSQPVSVVRFLDGSSQRWPSQIPGLRTWVINLSLLSERELRNLERFFSSQQGQYGTFVFPDPFSNQPVANCRLASPVHPSDFIRANAGNTQLCIVETNG